MVGAKTVQGPVRVWLATLADADLALLEWLDEREKERFRRYHRDADRARFLLGAAMFRAAVAQQSGVAPSEVPVDRTCDTCHAWHGKPIVPGSPFSLSVSHSGSLVALALTVSRPVGIDVERHGARDKGRKRRWTRREATFKAGPASGLVVHRLPTTVTGHVLSLACPAGAPVLVMAATDLLRSTDSCP